MNERPLPPNKIDFIRETLKDQDPKNPAWRMVAMLVATIDQQTDLIDQSTEDVIARLCRAAHSTALSKGFWDDIDKTDQRYVASLLALVHTEVSEATEALRRADLSNFTEELADVLIRVFDIAGGLGLNLAGAVRYKMAVNLVRSYRHGKEF